MDLTKKDLWEWQQKWVENCMEAGFTEKQAIFLLFRFVRHEADK